MRRPSPRILRVAAAAIAALLVVAQPTASAWAQDPISGFFNMIFRGGQPAPRAQRIEIPDGNAQPRRPAEPRVVETPKSPDAQTVLVLGDIEAVGLANGLQMAFAEEPSLQVATKTKNTLALTRESDSDWFGQTEKWVADAKADFLVAMVGINDWQSISLGGGVKPLEPGGEDWNRVYGERLDRWIGALKATGKPFWWVGLPPTADADLGPTKRAAFAAFLSSLNDLARPRVEAAGGHFVDVWAAFTDEEGHYTQMGPDVDGQVKRLRMNDGILFTRAGRRKLAFFVEGGILRLKRGEAPIAEPETPQIQPKVEEDIVGAPPALPPPPWSVAGPVTPLDGPTPGAETGLAGGATAVAPIALPGGYPVAATPAARLLVEGMPLDPPAGRVDAMARRRP
ncbi:MAG: hypothetical protein LWW93_17710 [Hyphomicrobiales bacterium]|nr:hypothetical protein [Hyphomicrobiales bacterium]